VSDGNEVSRAKRLKKKVRRKTIYSKVVQTKYEVEVKIQPHWLLKQSSDHCAVMALQRLKSANCSRIINFALDYLDV